MRRKAESTLRALGDRGDIVRPMRRALGGERRELVIGMSEIPCGSSAGAAV
jgi:hypothetical protein